MEKKYEFTNEQIIQNGVILHRIKALRDFGDVSAGDLGGFIEKEENLDHKGNAWVSGNARVSGNAQVYGNARVCGDARVYSKAEVYGNARVYGDAWVCGDARVYGDADYFFINGIGSRLGLTTVCKDKKFGISVKCGCFFGSVDEFEKKVEETHGDSKYGKEYRLLIDLIKVHFGTEEREEI